MKKNRWKIFFTVWSSLFLAVALINLGDVLLVHTPVFSGTYWAFDQAKNHFVLKKVIRDTPAEEAGLEAGDILLSIDQKTFTNLEDYYAYERSLKPGEVATFKIMRGEQEYVVPITLRSYGLSFSIISTIVGLLFLMVGYIVAMKKPRSYIPRLFYYFFFTFFLIIAFNFSSEVKPLSTLTTYLEIIGYILWAPAILHFFLNFPLRVPFLNKYPKIIGLFYLPSIITIPYLIFFKNQSKFLITGLIFIYIFFAIWALSGSRRKIINPHEIKSLRVITWGMILGLVPLGVLAIFSEIIIDTFGLTPVGVVFAFTSFVPIAFGYSIMRYGLMDVEIIVKKSLLYTMFTTSFILLYFLLVVGLGGFIVRQFGISSETSNLIFLAIVALVFQPVRNWIQNLIDRRFYRERYLYQKALLKLSQELPQMMNMKAISQKITETISKAMHVKTVLIDLYVEETESYKNQFSIGIEPNFDFSWKDERHSLVNIIKKEKKCCMFYKINEDERYNNLPLNDKVKIEKLGIVLSVPIFYQDSLIGIISLGQKQSGQVYNQEDMDLLETLAGNIAIALVNSKLHQEDIKKQRLENELLLARQIQKRLLPENDPEDPRVKITGFSKPAAIVGGDYYDYIPISRDKMYVCIGDVSGKGMPAALYMSKVQGMIQVAARNYKSPPKLLSEINYNLYRRMERKFFVTMAVALVDFRLRKLTLSRAGHTPVYIKRKDSLEKIVGRGIGLGLESGEVFEQQIEEKQVKLKKGEYCVLFSDGLIEAQNPDHDLFGEERLEAVLGSGLFNSADELKIGLLKEVKAFQKSAPQNDDITVVVFEGR